MRADAIAPRTWLLATVAGWAVLVWVLGLFGLGGRIQPLPVDPSLAANLPQARPAAASRVGPPDQYMQVAARPAFDPSRRPRPFFIEGQGGSATQSFDFALTSVLITPNLQMVILEPAQGGGNALRVKLGEEPEGNPGWRLAEVQPRSAVFDGPEGRRTLELRVYTGGGEAPTAAAPPTAADPTAAVAAGSPPVAVPKPATADAEKQLTPEQQMQRIRERIEARRAQLRLQQQQNSRPPGAPKPLSPPPER